MPLSSTNSSDKKKCKECQIELPETKFKPNGIKKDGSGSRRATCREDY